jgi:site-specific recombinase XerD
MAEPPDFLLITNPQGGKTMGDQLIEKMIRDIKTKGLSESTVRSYVSGVKKLSQFTGKPLEEIGVEDIRVFHLHLVEEEKLAPQTVNLYIAGIRFLFLTTLGRNWNPKITFPHTKVKRTLPVILSPERVVELIQAVEQPKYRAVLMTIYSAGLRVNEAVHLSASDILSDRMQIHVRFAKGGKERFSVLSEVCLEELRRYWKATPEDKRKFLFPGADRSQPLDPSSVRKVLTETKKKIGLEAKIRVHSLRHCFATHLLENGVDLRIIQLLLGHASISSTTIYTHLRNQRSLGVRSPLDVIAMKKAS